jgi:hypothetical protein
MTIEKQGKLKPRRRESTSRFFWNSSSITPTIALVEVALPSPDWKLFLRLHQFCCSLKRSLNW